MLSSKLTNILANEYGVGALYADPTTIIWATDRIEDAKEAKAELKKVNALREKYGRIPAYVPYGHRLF